MTQTFQAKVFMNISWEVLNFDNWNLDIICYLVLVIRQKPDKFWNLNTRV